MGQRTIEQLYCDRCGATIDEAHDEYFSLERRTPDGEEPQFWDLCTNCFSEDPTKFDQRPYNSEATKMVEPSDGGDMCIFDIQHIGRCSVSYMDLPDNVLSAPVGSTFRVHLPATSGIPAKWDRVL